MKILYNIIRHKYYLNEKFSISLENALFSTRLIFASEIFLNILTILMWVLMSHKAYLGTSISKFDVALVLSACAVLPLIILFGFIKKDKIIRNIEENTNPNMFVTIFVIIYSILSIMFFLLMAFEFRPIINTLN